MWLFRNVEDNVYFQHDGDVILRELSNTGFLRRYVYGPGEDEPILWYEGSGLSDKRYLHADERGSITALSNASGAVTQINAYDEFGIPQAKAPSGAPGSTATASFGRFGYTGQAWFPEIGLYHYKARTYSPTLGRFLQSDPIGYGDGMNVYNYVGGDPVNNTDPSGLQLQVTITGVIPRTPPPPPSRGFGPGGGFSVGGNDSGFGSYTNDRAQDFVDEQRENQRSNCVAAGRVFSIRSGAGQCDAPQQIQPNKALECAKAFGGNLLNNLVDPLSTAEGLVGLGSGLVGGVIDASIGSGAPAGGIVKIGGKTLRLARVGVGRSAIRTAGIALRGFAIGYAAVSVGVAIYQASQDKRCR